MFVPGGPGLGSESVAGLVDVVAPPGTSWLVDLPGDGSNRDGTDPYARWPDVLREAATALDDVIMVGHSTGGMFILATRGIDSHLRALALISSAPHAGWRARFADYARAHPLPAVADAARRYDENPSDESLRALTLAAAPWNFTASGLRAGVDVMKSLPYNSAAVQWADGNFDETYRAAWAPSVPTLIAAGEDDHVVDQSLWLDAPGFDGPNVTRRTIENAAHFPWIDNPDGTHAAFADWIGRELTPQ